MKNQLKFIAAIIIAALFASCGGNDKNIGEVKLIPVKSGDSFLYITQEGAIAIKSQFSQATVFRNGMALVKNSEKDKRWGFINEKGEYVIKPIYVNACVFNEGLAWVVAENAVPTAIDEKGKVIITLKDAKNVRIFKEGLAAYSVADTAGDKWGFIDKEGKTQIKPQFFGCGGFSDGKCAVKNKEGKWGYIDKDGKLIIPYQFDDAKAFENGQGIASTGEKYGVIDKSGKYIINPQYNDIIFDGKLLLAELDKKWGWYDMNGKVVINPQFSSAFPFYGKNLTSVMSESKLGFINTKGTYDINPRYDGALPFNGKNAVVIDSGKICFIDNKGLITFRSKYSRVSVDLIYYLLNGSSQYEGVQSDYINLDGITSMIKNEITANSFGGFNFSTPFSQILKKYNIADTSLKDYSYSLDLYKDKQTTTEITTDFTVRGNPKNLTFGKNYEVIYVYDPNFNPTGFYYSLSLSSTAYGKEDRIIDAIIKALPGYVKDTALSSEKEIILKNDYAVITITGSYYISLTIEPIAEIKNKKPALSDISTLMNSTLDMLKLDE